MYYGERKINELLIQNGILKRKLQLYESQDPIASTVAWYESRLAQKDRTLEKYSNGWEQCRATLRSTRTESENEKAENKALRKELKSVRKDRDRIQKERDRIQSSAQQLKSENEQLKRENEEKDQEIQTLRAQLAEKSAEIDHLQRIENRDGTNSGTPTSQTPRNKTKVIPNSREKSGRHAGSQEGHERHTMNEFDPKDADEIVSHELPESEQHCDHCGGRLIFTGKTRDREETDIETRVIKRLHKYYIYRCSGCGREICSSIPPGDDGKQSLWK